MFEVLVATEWVMDRPEDLQSSTPLMEITDFDHRLGSWCAAHCAQTAVYLIPPEVEARIFSKKATHPLADGERDTGPVEESCKVLKEVFSEVLDGVRGHGVTLGVNVESLSIFKEEIDAAHDLFQALQKMLLDDRGRAATTGPSSGTT